MQFTFVRTVAGAPNHRAALFLTAVVNLLAGVVSATMNALPLQTVNGLQSLDSLILPPPLPAVISVLHWYRIGTADHHFTILRDFARVPISSASYT
jgi:hypothetical protein